MNCFTCDSVECEQKNPGLCACGRDRRQGQYDCNQCHALANKVYRVRRAERVKSHERACVAALARGETPPIGGVNRTSKKTTNTKRAEEHGKSKTEASGAG